MTIPKILIVGYGSQGKVWAKNLHDNGIDFHIGLRLNSANIQIAQENGHSIVLLEKSNSNISNFDTVIILSPDEGHQNILGTISSHLKTGTKIIYAHGYSVDKEKLNQKYPNFSHLLLAPKAIASELRILFLEKKPVPAAFSLEFSLSPIEDLKTVQFIAQNIGMTGKLIQSTFREETFCDLFSEQSLLCSTIPFLIKKSYDNLVSQGISKELAFLECCLESKYIINTLLKVGFKDFFHLISPNALIGAHKATQLLFNDEFIQQFNSLFSDIKNGDFYTEIEDSNLERIRKKMVSLYEEGDIDVTRKNLQEYLN